MPIENSYLRPKLLGSQILEAHGFDLLHQNEYVRRDKFGTHRITLTKDGQFRHLIHRNPFYIASVVLLESHLSYLDSQVSDRPDFIPPMPSKEKEKEKEIFLPFETLKSLIRGR